jgi:hypothetical protein
MNMECELTAEIAFAKGEILEGEPVLKTLHESAQLVDGIIDAFQTAGLLRQVLTGAYPMTFAYDCDTAANRGSVLGPDLGRRYVIAGFLLSAVAVS